MAALFGIGIRGDETLLELIGFHIHIGKRLAEFIELIAVVVAGGLFNVVVVENLDGRGKPCAGAERNEHADAEHEDADKQRDDGELGRPLKMLEYGTMLKIVKPEESAFA